MIQIHRGKQTGKNGGKVAGNRKDGHTPGNNTDIPDRIAARHHAPGYQACLNGIKREDKALSEAHRIKRSVHEGVAEKNQHDGVFLNPDATCN